MDTGAKRIKISKPMKIIDAVLEAEDRLRRVGVTDTARLEAARYRTDGVDILVS